MLAALLVALGCAVLFKVGTSLSIRERGWRLLQDEHRFLLLGDGSSRMLNGNVLGVELRLREEPNGYGGKLRTRIDVLQPTPGWSCTYYNRKLRLAKIGTAIEIGEPALDRIVRYVPTPSHSSTMALPPAARDLLSGWFTRRSFTMRLTTVRWVRVGDGMIEIDLVGPGPSARFLERTVAEAVAFALALQGRALESAPLAPLRKSQLPVARALKEQVAGKPRNEKG